MTSHQNMSVLFKTSSSMGLNTNLTLCKLVYSSFYFCSDILLHVTDLHFALLGKQENIKLILMEIPCQD